MIENPAPSFSDLRSSPPADLPPVHGTDVSLQNAAPVPLNVALTENGASSGMNTAIKLKKNKGMISGKNVSRPTGELRESDGKKPDSPAFFLFPQIAGLCPWLFFVKGAYFFHPLQTGLSRKEIP